MNTGSIILEILSPEKRLFKGEVSRVYIPGKKAPFVILLNHAPIISLLDKGVVKWSNNDGEQEIAVASGVVEAKNNYVTVCIETIK